MAENKAENVAKVFDYPKARRDETIVEELHGNKICDPYRWMEDPDAEETQEFVAAQNSCSRPYIRSYADYEKVYDGLTELWNYTKYGVPYKHGNRYFFSKNEGLQNQNVICMLDNVYSIQEEVFFDPNKLSTDGTISLITYAFSEDGSIFAYGLSYSGSDWFDIHFKNVETGEDYPEVLKKAKYCRITWTHDNKGIFYSCYSDHIADKTTGRDITGQTNQKLYYHRIGTPQEEDVLALQFVEHPYWRINAHVSDCGEYLITCAQQDCRDNLVFFTNLKAVGKIDGPLPYTQVIFEMENDHEYVTNDGPIFVFRTNKNAPYYQLVTFNFDHPPEGNESKSWAMKTLVPEKSKCVLEWAICLNNNKLILCYLENFVNILHLHDLSTGKWLSTFTPEYGIIVGASGKKNDSEFFFKLTSMINPGIIYHADLSKNFEFQVHRMINIKGFQSDDFILTRTSAMNESLEIPVIIVYKKSLFKMDGSMPCLLYGYGGFNVSLLPSFSIQQLFFAQHFGVVAVANVRGGGELGEEWHNGGRLFNKQNSFNDFNCVAEHLAKLKYTSPSKLAIHGASNGGLLVAACCNQRPELHGAVIATVGVMDMLRFHKFTIGYAWCSDYGNPNEKEHFENLIKFSPLHNIRPPPNGGQYPAMLMLTADHDDRVVPSHTLKFVAELHHIMGRLPQQTNPILARIETRAGHGQGKPTQKSIEETVDVFAFLAKALNYTYVD